MNNNFDDDLADGHKGEQAVRHFVESVWNKRFMTYGNTNKFDIMFQGHLEGPTFFEVKTDYFEKDWSAACTHNSLPKDGPPSFYCK